MKKSNLHRKRGFTLLELIVSLIISGILFVSIFSFVYQFAAVFRETRRQEASRDPFEQLLTYLRAELRLTNAVKLRELKGGQELRFQIPRLEGREAITGKEVSVTADARGRVEILEQYFHWSYREYIEGNRNRRQARDQLEKKITLPAEHSVRLEVVTGDSEGTPALLRLTTRSPEKSSVHLIRLGSI